jgi:hypothetical protein
MTKDLSQFTVQVTETIRDAMMKITANTVTNAVAKLLICDVTR